MNDGAPLSLTQRLVTQVGSNAWIQVYLDKDRRADDLDLDGDGDGDTEMVRIELYDTDVATLGINDFIF